MINGDNVYGAIGSDHTDRDLETDSIPKSKLIYPNIISKEIWFLEDIRGVWDQLLLELSSLGRNQLLIRNGLSSAAGRDQAIKDCVTA